MDKHLKRFIFKSVGLAMGIATLVLNIIKAPEIKTSITLLSIGLICLAISEIENKKES